MAAMLVMLSLTLFRLWDSKNSGLIHSLSAWSRSASLMGLGACDPESAAYYPIHREGCKTLQGPLRHEHPFRVIKQQ